MSRLQLTFDCCANEAFEDKKLLAENYDEVIWLCGDESIVDEPLNFTEVSLLANYLRKGGQLLLSGSDVGLVLDYHGSAQEKKFFNEYLKTKYVSNGSAGNGFRVSGEPGSIFSGLAFDFDDGASGFAVLQPDIYDTTGGSFVCLKYSSTGEIAAIQYSGTIGNGASPAHIVNLGFPFEAVVEEAQIDSFLLRTMSYFDFFYTTKVSTERQLAKDFDVVYNFPNPFNPETTIYYSISQNKLMPVSLKIFDLMGREIKMLAHENQTAGQYKITWNGKDNFGTNVTSGIYFFLLSLGKKAISKKMILVR